MIKTSLHHHQFVDSRTATTLILVLKKHILDETIHKKNHTMIKPKAKRILTIFTCLRFLGTFSCAFKTLVNKGCRYPCPSMEIQGFSSGFVVGQSPAHKPLYSTTPDGMDGARHSYVEGSTFDNRLAEIEAMGGGTRKNPFAMRFVLF